MTESEKFLEIVREMFDSIPRMQIDHRSSMAKKYQERERWRKELDKQLYLAKDMLNEYIDSERIPQNDSNVIYKAIIAMYNTLYI